MKNTLILILFLFSCSTKTSYQKYLKGIYEIKDKKLNKDLSFNQCRIIGYVRDRRTGKLLPYANVTIKDSSIGVQTDSTGYFSLNFNAGKNYKISVFNAGNIELTTKALELKDKEQLELTFYLGSFRM